ncbi:hypothetical protein ACJMK2_028020 [Sinanodonta woodiana]|uniref:Major facilitator superfamily (MFS) profile domain-containing protein n=1 Tax=Sinanodonta woodiana TaxID=1069815 RepID=A0ABD3X9A5_SINWO
MRYDDLLSLLGDFGRYQKILYCILVIPTGIISMQIMSPIFILAVPDHRCALPDLSNDTYAIQNEEHEQLVNKYIPMTTDYTGAASYSSCTIYDRSVNSTGMNISKEVPCSKWVYDMSVFQDTVVTEINLVCEKTIYRAHATTSLNVGSLLGFIIMGSVSDRFGRKKTYVLLIVLTAVFSFLLVWTPSIYVFVAIRFFVGFTVGVSYNTTFVYVMEFIGPSKRILCGMFVNHVWTFGLFIYTGLAYGIRTWKNLQIASAVPSCFLIVYWWLIPESLRWLVSMGMRSEADQIIQKMAKVNKVTLPIEPLNLQITSSGTGTVVGLFSSKVLLIRTVIIFINWLTVSMMYYGLSLNVGNLGGDIYVNFAYSTIMEFVAYTISIPAISLLGRKKFHCLSMSVGGLALLATIFPSVIADKRSSLVITILAMIGKFASAAAFGTIYLYSSELFPTVVRSAGMGASAFCAGVGGIIAPYIVELANLTEGRARDVLPLIVFGIPSLLAGGLSLLLPETSKIHLPDSISDAKQLNRHTDTEFKRNENNNVI